MICINANIPNLSFRDTICFYIFKNREQRNEFVETTKGMNKANRERVYQKYQS